MNLGDVIALDAVAYRDGVKTERFRQHIQGLLVTHRDVHPYNSVWTFEQLRELFNLMPLQTCIAHKQDIHTFTALPATDRIRARNTRIRWPPTRQPSRIHSTVPRQGPDLGVARGGGWS